MAALSFRRIVTTCTLSAGLVFLQSCDRIGSSGGAKESPEEAAKAANTRTKEGKLPLQLAIEKGQLAEVNALLAKGASPNEGWQGRPLLHLAAEQGSLEIVQALMGKGADVKSQTQSDKYGALHAAGSRPVAEFLVAQGLEVNAQSVYRETPLHLAARRGNADVVEYLLEQGADPNAQARDMDVAALNYASTGPVAELLLAKGAAANGRTNRWGRVTPPLVTAAREGRTDVVTTLLSHGAGINWAGSSGDATALEMAVDFGHADLVRLLLEKGGQVLPRNANMPATLLSKAAMRRHTEVVKVLLERGLNPNAQGKQPPLYEAARVGDVEIVKLLLEHGANPRLQSTWPSALHGAATGKLLNPIRSAGHAKKENASPADYLACLQALLDKGADPRAVNLSGVTPLHVAATHNFKDAVALLLEKGAEANAKDKLSATPLHWAAINNSVEAASLLLAAGADPNAALADKVTVTSSQPWEVPNPFGGRPVSRQRALDLTTSEPLKALLIKAGGTPGAGAAKP